MKKRIALMPVIMLWLIAGCGDEDSPLAPPRA